MEVAIEMKLQKDLDQSLFFRFGENDYHWDRSSFIFGKTFVPFSLINNLHWFQFCTNWKACSFVAFHEAILKVKEFGFSLHFEASFQQFEILSLFCLDLLISLVFYLGEVDVKLVQSYLAILTCLHTLFIFSSFSLKLQTKPISLFQVKKAQPQD